MVGIQFLNCIKDFFQVIGMLFAMLISLPFIPLLFGILWLWGKVWGMALKSPEDLDEQTKLANEWEEKQKKQDEKIHSYIDWENSLKSHKQ